MYQQRRLTHSAPFRLKTIWRLQLKAVARKHKQLQTTHTTTALDTSHRPVAKPLHKKGHNFVFNTYNRVMSLCQVVALMFVKKCVKFFNISFNIIGYMIKLKNI